VTTKADKYREAAFKMVGDPYGLGYEGNPDDVADPKYDVYDAPGSNPKLGDCSGDVWSALIYAGAFLDGTPVDKGDRRTANGWYHKGAPIAQPAKVGDQGFLVNSDDHAYHMFTYIGLGQVFEMGYNHQARVTTVSNENARGAKWRRQNLDLGELTTEPVAGTIAVPIWPLLYKGVHSSDPVRQRVIAAAVHDYKTVMNRIQAAGLHPDDDDYLDRCVAATKKFQSNPGHLDADDKTLTIDGEVGPKTRYAIAVALSGL